MKILLVIPALNAGGAERVMVTLANEWALENKVDMLLFNEGHCFYDLSDSVNIIPMRLMPPKNGIKRKLFIPIIELKRLRKIENVIKKGNYDFVLSFTYTANVFCALISRKMKGENIFISERCDPLRYPSYLQKIFLKIYQWSKGIVCQNEMVRDYYIRHGFTNNLMVLSNPVNFDDIPSKTSLNKEKVIVNVGRLTEQKNQKLLIDAFYEVKKIYPEYILKIYGIGPLKHELQMHITELGLENSVFLMGAKKKVMEDVNNASIFVLSSDFEGFPNVLIEAMATYMPVISSNFETGVAQKLIQSDENGYLFKVGDKGDLVSKILMLLSRENEFHDMGKKNRIIAEQYESCIMAKKWIEKFKDIIA